MVDLTLDSSDEEGEEEEEETQPQAYDQDEEMFHSDEGEEEDEDRQQDHETSSWAGIESTTPFTDLSHHPSHHQSPQVAQLLDSFLDQPTEPYPFMQPPLDQAYPAEMLDPAMFQQQSSFQPILAEQYVDPRTASLLDEVLAFQADQSLLTLYPAEQKEETMQIDEQVVETGVAVDVVDTTAGLEFLTGLLPMGEMEKLKRNERERSESREFLPNIVPEQSNEKVTEAEPVSMDPAQGMQMDGGMDIQNGPQSHTEGLIMTTGPMDLVDNIQHLKRAEPIVHATPRERPRTVKDTPSSPSKPSEPDSIKERPRPTSTVTTVHEPQTVPAPQSIPHRSLSPSPLPEDWSTEGLQTPLSYFPPLSTITPPSLRPQKFNPTVDIIGIIRHTTPISKSHNGPDFVLPLHLVDPSTGPNSGLSVLLFRPHKSALPAHADVGAVFLATNMKVQSHQHRAQVRTGEDSGWVVFPLEGSGEVVGDMGPPVEFGEEERVMVKKLQWWWRQSLEKGEVKRSNEEGVAVNGEMGSKEVNGTSGGSGGGHVKPRMKLKPRGGGKVVNLNRL